MQTPSEILAELQQIKYDLSVTQTRVSDAIRHLAALELPDRPRPRCSTCGTRFPSLARCQEHVYHQHGGPLPDSYAAAERAAGINA